MELHRLERRPERAIVAGLLRITTARKSPNTLVRRLFLCLLTLLSPVSPAFALTADPTLAQPEPARRIDEWAVDEELKRRLDEMRERVELRREHSKKERRNYHLVLPDPESPDFPAELFLILPQEVER